MDETQLFVICCAILITFIAGASSFRDSTPMEIQIFIVFFFIIAPTLYGLFNLIFMIAKSWGV